MGAPDKSVQRWAGGGGRIHRQIATTDMQSIDSAFTHTGTHQSMIKAHANMVTRAIYLSWRLTAPYACQSRMNALNCGCPSNHACNRSDPRAAAHAEITPDTAAGKPGTKMPTLTILKLR